MQEHFPHSDSHSLESRIDAIVERQLREIELQQEGVQPEQLAVYREKANEFKKRLPEMMDDEAKEYLAGVNDEEFGALVLPALARQHERGKEHVPLTKIQLQNILLYRKVYGYGHPDLEKRIEQHPMPTAAELLLGCYAEQLEEQTRDAVLLMRKKGYDTVQSGFHDTLKGSQFFDIYEANQTMVPQEIIDEMKSRFGVDVTSKRHKSSERTDIDLVPTGFKDIADWKETLNHFAAIMPTKEEQGLGQYGMGVDFIYDAIKTYKKEDILETAETDQQRVLVERLYECKNKEEVILLLHKESDSAEQRVVEERLKEEAKKDFSPDTVEAINQIISEFISASFVIDKEDIEAGLQIIRDQCTHIGEIYTDDASHGKLFAIINQAIQYLENRLEKK
ncbi:MAG TPA: hypothetical protein VGE18_00450 [Candidatus Paceibacterota bacterium]